MARIFAAKQRPSTDPLIVHRRRKSSQTNHSRHSACSRASGRAFWPGPLTLVVRRGAHAPNVSSGYATRGRARPGAPGCCTLLAACDLPIAAPSANLFSRPSPTTAQHVLADLDGRVDIILDGGPATIGLESTLIDLTQTPPVLLRPGGVPAELLLDVLPVARARRPADRTEGEAASSPGTLFQALRTTARRSSCCAGMPPLPATWRRQSLRCCSKGLRAGLLAGRRVAALCRSWCRGRGAGAVGRSAGGSALSVCAPPQSWTAWGGSDPARGSTPPGWVSPSATAFSAPPKGGARCRRLSILARWLATLPPGSPSPIRSRSVRPAGVFDATITARHGTDL